MTESTQGDCAKQGKEWAQENESEEFSCNTESSQNIIHKIIFMYLSVQQKLTHYKLTTIRFFLNNKTLSFLGLKLRAKKKFNIS